MTQELRVQVRFIDTCAVLTNFIYSLINWPPISLYVDLGGINLSREGTITIMQILVHPSNGIYLIDIYTLGYNAFRASGLLGKTFKGVLEDVRIRKFSSMCAMIRTLYLALWYSACWGAGYPAHGGSNGKVYRSSF